MICNRDCFNCPYDDCVQDKLTYEEVLLSRKTDERIKAERLQQRSNECIKTGKKGRPRKVVHAHETVERQEWMRSYYIEHRAEKLAYQGKYNEEHAEEIRKKQREYYLAHREEKLAYAKRRKELIKSGEWKKGK
jgi:hypothetical protein